MVLTFPRTVNKLKRLNSCYFWISKAILFTLTYYIVIVWINVKCVILLKPEHLHVPLLVDWAVESNLLKSTRNQHYRKLPSQSHYSSLCEGDLGLGRISFCNKYGFSPELERSDTICSLKSNCFARCRYPTDTGSPLLWRPPCHDNPSRSVEQHLVRSLIVTLMQAD